MCGKTGVFPDSVCCLENSIFSMLCDEKELFHVCDCSFTTIPHYLLLTPFPTYLTVGAVMLCLPGKSDF